MNIIPKSFDINQDEEIKRIIEIFKSREKELNLDKAHIFLEFPLYKDDDDTVIMTQVLVLSPSHGVIIIYSSDISRSDQELIRKEDAILDKIAGHITSKLFKNDKLRSGLMGLSIPVDAILFARNLDGQDLSEVKTKQHIITSTVDFIDRFKKVEPDSVEGTLVEEAISSLQGAKGLIRPAERQVSAYGPDSKAAKIHAVESKILKFDNDQQDGYIPAIDGPHRIRGLAGSGKTVILTMKVVQTLLRESNRKTSVLYTFSTKSLYQHVKRLIHRFFREFHDDMSYLDCVNVLHAWGGRTNPGVYYNACIAHGVEPLTFSEAQSSSTIDLQPFEYACKKLLESTEIKPIYDYVFVDEAQDYGKYYLLLCSKLAKDNRVTFGSDVFQNIFQKKVISAHEIFGGLLEFKQDDYLETCYRTPLAILVAAHSIGLGVYGEQVQTIDDVDSWKGFGYEVIGRKSGEFNVNEDVDVKRSATKSPTLAGENTDELIKYHGNFKNTSQETIHVSSLISNDIKKQGLLPEDILVICVDDRSCNSYFSQINDLLSAEGIETNNVNSNKYSINDFHVKGRVTLSTIHKAKGNEAYCVYVIGCDALCHNLNLRSRNLLFTAMTRTKGWIYMTGCGDSPQILFKELETAKRNIPHIKFKFPTEQNLERIKSDLRKDKNPSLNKIRELEEMAKIVGGTEELQRMLEEIKANEAKK